MNWNALTAPAIEHRALAAAGSVELRTTRGRPVIAGLAAPFGKYSRDVGGFIEEISPLAFRDSQGRRWPNVSARYQHSDLFLLGTSYAGPDRPSPTLRLDVTRNGLEYEVDPPKARADVVELIERRDVRYSSFAFRTIEDAWGLTAEGYPLRTIVSAMLVDVAPVIDPAYRNTTTALRSLAIASDTDASEVRQLAAAGNLLVLYDGGRHAKPMRRGAVLGARAREQIERLAINPYRDS